jgi:type III pantothenate kinase
VLLAIDIGNTSISIGVLKSLNVVGNFHIDQAYIKTSLEKKLKSQLKQIKNKFPEIKRIAVCSVVPQLNKRMARKIQKIFAIKPLFVGIDLEVPIKNKYDNPKQVGQDRLVGAFAAKSLYGAPAIIIDFGTAITFDVVSQKGDYEGGMIIPGIRLSAESLFHKTALLPRVEKIKAPKALVGKNTQESILSGIFHGYGAMSSGLIDMISKSLKGHPKVIVTGGYTDLMKKFISKKTYKIDHHLVFKGLALLVNQF